MKRSSPHLRRTATVIAGYKHLKVSIRHLAAAATLGLLVSAGPAVAIVGGAPDGDGHPYVGNIDTRLLGGENSFASGVLISPTVFLTAAHLSRVYDRMGVTEARVTFEPNAVSATSWHTGTIHTNPAYQPGGTPGEDVGDLAVVVFDAPVTGITPASLPSLGLIDQVPRGSRPRFDVLGYGCQAYLSPPNNGGRPGPDADFSTSGVRKLANATFVRVNGPLQLDMDAGAEACRGDSGGPSLFAGSNVLAGIMIGGFRGTTFEQRVDTAAARAFLEHYVTLP